MIVLEVLNPFSAVLVLVAGTAALQGRQIWFLADFLGSVACGLLFFVAPRLVLNVQTDVRLDVVSLHMTRALGAMLVTGGLNAYTAYAAESAEEKNALVVSRTLGNTILFTCLAYAQVHYSEWNATHIKVGFVGCIVWTVPYIAHYLVGHLSWQVAASGQGPHDLKQGTVPPVHVVFLLVDQLGSFVIGAVLLAFPQWLLRHQVRVSLNGVSVHVARSVGCLLMSSAMVTGAAASFSSRDSKKGVLLARGVGGLMLAMATVTAHASGPFSRTHLIVGVFGTSLWVANAFLGYMAINHAASVEVLRETVKTTHHSMPRQRSEPAVVLPRSPMHPYTNSYDVGAAAVSGRGLRSGDAYSAANSVTAALGKVSRRPSGSRSSKKHT